MLLGLGMGMQELGKGCRTGVQSVQSRAGAVVVRGGFREDTEGCREVRGGCWGRQKCTGADRLQERLGKVQGESRGDAGRIQGAAGELGRHCSEDARGTGEMREDWRSGGDAVTAQRGWRGTQTPHREPGLPPRYLRAQRSGANMAATPGAPPPERRCANHRPHSHRDPALQLGPAPQIGTAP